MKRIIGATAVLVSGILAAFSFGFMDPNLHLSANPWYTQTLAHLVRFVYRDSYRAAGLYALIIIILHWLYRMILAGVRPGSAPKKYAALLWIAAILVFSYPALSYDVFNYILTAKVTFLYGENPYVVMPVEIPNEPMLGFTRAANKLALYGPVWILLTALPHAISLGNIFAAILSFKALVISGYFVLVWLIWKETRQMRQVLFFAANPLIVVETFVSGHNDTVMMALAVAGIMLWMKTVRSAKVVGIVLVLSSVLVKGATIALVPLLFLRHTDRETFMRRAYWLLFAVFLVSPLREEMYPWYAIWWLSAAAFVPITAGSFIHGFSFWLTLGLMLGYIPWIATREYGGITPIVRMWLTWTPVLLFLLTRVWQKFRIDSR